MENVDIAHPCNCKKGVLGFMKDVLKNSPKLLHTFSAKNGASPDCNL